MAKQPKLSVAAVRTRRAYFDCQFGQLHVRTAFPTTGGFDEGVTLFCLHPVDESSRTFDTFLPAIATDRSVYAPDLPGCGESDAAPAMTAVHAAGAMADLARDLRLRQIDVLGFRFGAAVALELAALQPQLVRRLVLLAVPTGDRVSMAALPHAKFLDLADYTADLFSASPTALAQQIGAFLGA